MLSFTEWLQEGHKEPKKGSTLTYTKDKSGMDLYDEDGNHMGSFDNISNIKSWMKKNGYTNKLKAK